MTRQLDLPGHAGLELEPEAGRSEQRLWVRRFVIRSEPGVMLREIHLRPGLNIIRAPDPADRVAVSGGDDTVGHGSGKTLLCRLLRYCLGEDRFAPAEQRARIAGAFPEAMESARRRPAARHSAGLTWNSASESSVHSALMWLVHPVALIDLRRVVASVESFF